MAKACGCGQALYGLGKRCQRCQAAHRQARAALRPLVPKRPRKPPQGRDLAHLAWIRTLPCTIAGCNGATVPAHVRQNTGAGMGMKPADHWTVPLCCHHHDEQHALGHRAFDAQYGVQLRRYAALLSARRQSFNWAVASLQEPAG